MTDASSAFCSKHIPWNKGKIIGAKPPLRPKHVWSTHGKTFSSSMRQERSFHEYYANKYCIGLERGRRELDPSSQLRGNGRRKTTGQYPGDRYFRRKTRARRIKAAGLRLALSVRSS